MTNFNGKCLLLNLKLFNLKHYFYDFEIYQSPSSDIPTEILTGGNQKKLLVVVEVDDFTDENKAFLAKILGAVKYDMSNDASLLVLQNGQPLAVNSLLHTDKYTNALIFGIKPKDIGLSIETFLYAPFSISGKKLLIGHSLEKIKSSTDLKKNLWTALQAIFI